MAKIRLVASAGAFGHGKVRRGLRTPYIWQRNSNGWERAGRRARHVQSVRSVDGGPERAAVAEALAVGLGVEAGYALVNEVVDLADEGVQLGHAVARRAAVDALEAAE